MSDVGNEVQPDDLVISDEEMQRLRRLVDAHPEVVLFIVEELIAVLEERHLLEAGALREIIGGALAKWQEAGEE